MVSFKTCAFVWTFIMTYRTVCSAISIGVIMVWAEGFNNSITNQMCDIMKEFLAKNLHVTSAFLWSFFVACHRPSVLIGTLISPYLIDNFGRKRMMAACAIPCIIALLLQTMSYSLEHPILMFLGRFILGFKTGLSVVAGGVFLSETSTKVNRGTRTATIMSQYTVSCFIASILCLDQLMGTSELWNYIFLVPAAAIFVSLLVTLRCPETPAFLNRHCKPVSVVDHSLKFYSPSAKPTEQEISELQLELENHEKHLRSLKLSFTQKVKLLKDPHLRLSCIVTLALTFAYSVSGMILLSSYSTSVLESLGMATSMAKIFTVVLVFVNLIAANCGKFFLESYGRRNVVLISTFGCGFLQISLGILCELGTENSSTVIQWVVAVLMILCSSFAFAVSQVYHVLIPEIFPYRARSSARALAGIIEDICCFMILLLFFPIYQTSPLGAFALVFIPTILCAVVLFLFCPETKGKEIGEILEEIGNRFLERKKSNETGLKETSSSDSIDENTPLIMPI